MLGYCSIVALFTGAMVLVGCSRTIDPREADIDKRLSRLVQVPMHFDGRRLSENDRVFLQKLIEAGKLVHTAYLHQMYPPGVGLRDSLARLSDSFSTKLHRLVVRNGGPFDKMDHFTNFVGDYQRPAGAWFYPPELTKEEFEAYVAAHPQDADALMSPYTVIRRQGEKLVAVPFHREYAQWIQPAAALLREAAALTTNASLRKHLASRADALLNDDYYQSDIDWIDLEGNDYDIIIAPYETYEDGLMGIKASYEATIGVKEREETAKLEVYTKYLDELEQYLPHHQKYKRSIKGLASPMVVVRDIFRGGDIATGYQPMAANLPNDPKVHTTKGTKKTFWKNVGEARLNYIILPVARELIASDQIRYVTPQGLFNFVLMHELCHALGPQYVHGSEGKVTVNQALKEHNSAIEEAKADMAGLHSIKYYIDRGIIPKELEREHYVSYLASVFRTIRFGTTEAHGKAAICELNYLRDRGGIRLDSATRKWSVNFNLIGQAISDLAHDLLTMQAVGDYAAVEEFFIRWAPAPKDVSEALKGLDHLPVDVEPVYTIRWE